MCRAIERLFKKRSCTQYLEVLARPRHDLQTNRPAVDGEANRHRDDWTAGERQYEGQVHPIDIRVQRFAADFCRKALRYRIRRHRYSRTGKDIVLAEESRDAHEYLAAHPLGAGNRAAILLQSFLYIPDYLRANEFAMRAEQWAAHGSDQARSQGLKRLKSVGEIRVAIIDLGTKLGKSASSDIAVHCDFRIHLSDSKIRGVAHAPWRAWMAHCFDERNRRRRNGKRIA